MDNILSDIHQYNQTLTISQVVKFFEKKGIHVTKSMIQNYVRDGLLPPPINKRHYTPKHLTTLALIHYLKNIYEITAIKNALAPFMEEEGISPEIYTQVTQRLEKLSAHWTEQIATQFFNKETPKPLSLLLLMAHSVDLLDLVTDTAEALQA